MTTRPELCAAPLQLLRQINPAPEAPSSAGVEEALDQLARAISRQPYARRPHGLSARLKIAVAAGVLAIVGVGVATAAVALHAHTGVFASGPNASVGGPGEELNPAAPDFRSSALKLSADISYPAGYESWRGWVVTEQASGPGGATADEQVTTGALRGWFAASAFCAWVQDWRQATSSGDSAEAQQAEATVASAPNWSAVTAEDPHPSPSAPNDPGAKPGTLFGWMLPYRSAVLAGDQAAVDQMLASGYGDGRCWIADPQWMAALDAHSAWSKVSPQGLARRYEQFLAEERP